MESSRQAAVLITCLMAAFAAGTAAQTPDGGEQGGAPPADPGRIEAVADSIVHHALATDVAPGITVAVARDGEVVLEKGYGTADVEMGVVAGPATVYRIGSITKQFTAAVVMRLVEQGRLSLDAPITDYLPDYPAQGRTVTIRHLLTHTSGIPSYTGLGETFWSKARLDLTEAELIALFDELPYDFEPGADYRYNNSAYYLLGVVIGEVTGTPYPEHLESTLLAELGLEHTLYCDNTRIVPGRAEGYAYTEADGLVNAEYISMANPGAAGAMCSTVGDLVRWTEGLHDGDVVSPSSLGAMTTPAVLTSGDTTSYGFGLGLGELEGHRRVSHGGGINGFTSFLAHYPDDGLTVAVLTNSGSGDPGVIEDALARTALGIPLQLVEDLPLTDEEMRRYTGRYVLRTGEEELPIRVYVEGGDLFAQAEGQSPSRLLYQGEDVFIPDFSSAVRIVFRGEGRQADVLILQQGGAEYRGERVN